jgi:recombination protein RecA
VQKSGSYFSFGDERLGQGRQNATAFLREHPDVTQQILARVQSEAVEGQVVSARLLPTLEPAESQKAEKAGRAAAAVAVAAGAENGSEDGAGR